MDNEEMLLSLLTKFLKDCFDNVILFNHVLQILPFSLSHF